MTKFKLTSLFLTALLLLIIGLSVNGQYIVDQRIRASSVNISYQQGNGSGSGSGFFLQDTIFHEMFIVTANHVLMENNETKNGVPAFIIVTGYRENADTDTTFKFRIDMKESMETGNYKFDTVNDVAVIRVATMIPSGDFNKIVYFSNVSKLTGNTLINSWPLSESATIEQVQAGTDLFVIGFPQSLELKNRYDMMRPLMRKGIIAGKDFKYNKIIGDGAVYPGNSGGIAVGVVQDSQTLVLKLVGLITEYVPFDASLFDRNGRRSTLDYRNSGYSVIVPTNQILAVIKTFH